MSRDETLTAVMAVISVLAWVAGIILFALAQPVSACFMFIAAGLLLVYPVLQGLRAYDTPGHGRD